MKQQIEYDSFCTEIKCFEEKKSFFKFDPDNIHIVEGHETRAISKVTFNRFIKKEQKENISNVEVAYSLHSAIDDFIRELTNLLKLNLFDKYVKIAEDFTKTERDIDLQTFTLGMKVGNYSFLESYLKFQKKQYFIEEKQKTKIDEIIPRIVSEMENRKSELLNLMMIYCQIYSENIPSAIIQGKKQIKNQTIEVLNRMTLQYGRLESFFNQKQSQKEEERNQKLLIKNSQNRIDSIDGKALVMENEEVDGRQINAPQKIKMEQNISLDDTFKLFLKDKKENKSQMNVESSQEEPSQKEKSLQSVGKHKIIEKEEKEKEKPKRKPAKRRPFIEDIILVGENQVAIKEVYTEKSTFKKIKNICPNLKSVHIFDQSFTRLRFIKALFANFQNIQELSFNCQMETRILTELEPTIKNLKRLCLDWDLLNNHREYFIQSYFPKFHENCCSIDKEKNQKRIFLYQNNPDNNHIWWFDEKQKVPIKKEIQSCEICCKLISSPQITTVTTLKSLTVNSHFSIEDYNTFFPYNLELDGELASLIKRNSHLQTVCLKNLLISIEYNCKTQKTTWLRNTFQSLRTLPLLQVLFISHSSQFQQFPMIVKANQLLKLKQLKHLYLENIKLVEEKDRTVSPTFFQNLGPLESLSLYKCSNIDSHHINKLSAECLQSLTFLNLGKTKVDNTCLKTISKMKQLTHLQLQHLPISVGDLIQMCLDYQQMYKASHPLIRLNLKLKMLKWKKTAFQNILTNAYKDQTAIQIHPYHGSYSFTEKLREQINREEISEKLSGAEKNIWNIFVSTNKWQPEKMSHDQKEEIKLRYTSNVDDLALLSKYLPKLEYLNIVNNLNYMYFDYHCFPSLRTLVDSSVFGDSNIKTSDKTKVYLYDGKQTYHLS